MFDVTEQVGLGWGLGWGGVGMFTFLEHAHMSLTSMFDVTEQVGLGWGGVGWGGDVHVLRTCTHELDFHV